MLELVASYNEQVGALVLGNALCKAKYTSPTSQQTQKEFLQVWPLIHHEIGDVKI